MAHKGRKGKLARRGYGKRGVPNHRVICSHTCKRLTSAIEKRERQAAKRAIRNKDY